MTVKKTAAGAATISKAAAKPATDGEKPANLKPATDFEASGGVIEDGAKNIDMSHPAVDSNPRENSTADMNRIDFNKPSGLTPPEEAVEENLKSQD